MLLTVQTPSLAGEGLARLEEEWRTLERQAASASFFQSWSWIGCRIAERFTAPVLVRAAAGGTTVGLALFNRHALPLAPRALWLHQTGDTAEDSVFIEQNGILVSDSYPEATNHILKAGVRHAGALVLGGVADSVAEAARGLGRVGAHVRRQAPYAALGGGEAAWLAARGSATRSQLQRSRRHLGALGPITTRRAGSVAEALGFLQQLARLHQAAWVRRGQPGAFAQPAFGRFHAALVAQCVPRGEVALWQVSAGAQPIGYLYNLHWRGQVLSYQSGFDTEAAPRASPGLLAHALAIGAAAAAGCDRYDFLAGDTRYKRELSDGSYGLNWFELTTPWHPRGLYQLGRARLRAATTGIPPC